MTTPVNVFGAPVPGKDGKERATKAYSDPNAGNKQSLAAEWVKEQKDRWGETGVATLSIFYNATGQQLNVTGPPNSKYGHFYDHVDPPPVVENGQWGAFLHVQQDDVTTVSEGFVAYEGVNKDNSTFSNELLGWMTTRSNNIVHCDIFPATVDPPPDQIYKDIENHPQSDVKKIGMHVKATLEADHGHFISKYILTRDDVP